MEVGRGTEERMEFEDIDFRSSCPPALGDHSGGEVEALG